MKTILLFPLLLASSVMAQEYRPNTAPLSNGEKDQEQIGILFWK